MDALGQRRSPDEDVQTVDITVSDNGVDASVIRAAARGARVSDPHNIGAQIIENRRLEQEERGFAAGELAEPDRPIIVMPAQFSQGSLIERRMHRINRLVRELNGLRAENPTPAHPLNFPSVPLANPPSPTGEDPMDVDDN